MKIGIIGGTFNPIHSGHLIMGEYARTALKLDKIIFIPVGLAPHKDNNRILDGRIRAKMVDLAIKSNPYFHLSLIEIERKEVAYTIDTILSLREKYKKDELYFIMGGDSIFKIESWKDSEDLMRICKFIVLNRGSKNKEAINVKIDQLKKEYGIDARSIESPMIEISSTEIRNRIKNNLSIKYLVPEKLEKYIIKNKLYN